VRRLNDWFTDRIAAVDTKMGSVLRERIREPRAGSGRGPDGRRIVGQAAR
jgi:hypothetical protein